MPTQTPSNAGTPTAPSTCDTHPVPAGGPPSPWPTVDATKLREAIARVVDSTRGSPPTPAMNFGAFVRKDLDATPAWNLGASAIAKLLRLDPIVQKKVDHGRGPTPCERLMELWGTEEGKVFLHTAKDIATIAKRIGKGPTVTKASPFFKSTIAPARKAHKSLMKYETVAARDRAALAVEKANARSKSRRSNRPRNRPTE